MRVFLSYRRRESGGHAGRLYDALAERLGGKAVFHDISAIAPGEDFVVAIDRELGRSDVVLAVIGPDWLSMAGPDGVPRLHREDDYVRLELTRALDLDRTVVPVLVGGADLPSAAELPPPLAGLTRRQAVVLRDESWRQDVDHLVDLLRGDSPTPASARRRRRLAAVGAVMLALAVGGPSWLLVRDDAGESAAAPEPPTCDLSSEGGTELGLAADPSVEIDDDGPLIFEVADARARPVGGGGWRVLLRTNLENRTGDYVNHGDWYYGLLVVGQRPFEGVACMSADPVLVPPDTVGGAVVGFDVTCEPTGRIELRISYTSEAQGDQERRITVTSDPSPSDC